MWTCVNDCFNAERIPISIRSPQKSMFSIDFAASSEHNDMREG